MVMIFILWLIYRMSLIGQDPFYYTSLLNEEQISSTAINYIGLTTGSVIGYDGQTLTSNITTDGLTEGFSNLYFTNARSRSAISGGTGISYSSSTGVISNSGVISLAGTANRVTVSGSTGAITISGPQDIQTSSSPTFAGLTVGSLSGVLKATAGVLSGSATTSDLPEGSGLYYTDARARAAISGGTGISYSPSTGVISASGSGVTSITGTANQIIVSGSTAVTLSTPQNIATTSSPQFLRLASSSLGTQNVLCGDLSGGAITSGSYNVFIGSGAGQQCTTGTNNLAIGYQALNQSQTGQNNVAFGNTCGYSMLAGQNNVLMGNSAGMGATPITGGVYCCYIGAAAYPSSASPTREIVIGAMTGNGSNTCSIYAPSGLYVSNLTSGVLKAVGSLVSTGATTSDLPEGSQLYFTTARVQSAVSVTAPLANSGGSIQLGYTGNLKLTASTLDTIQPITTGSSPQFARVSSSSLGTQNVLEGTNAGAVVTTANSCTAIGHGALASLTSGSYNTALGGFAGTSITTSSYNTLLGSSTGYGITTGVGNTGVGYQNLQNLVNGSYNIHLGHNTQTSSTSVSNEVVIGSGSTTTIGKGANSCFINSPAGLYSYSPAYCTLVSTAFSNSLVTWAFFNDGTVTYNQGFTLYNSNTLIVQPFAGLYEFTITANMLNTTNYCQVSYVVTNIGTTNLAFNSPAVASFLGCVTGCTQYRPYVSSTPTSTGIGVYLNGGNHYGPYPARMTIRFIGL